MVSADRTCWWASVVLLVGMGVGTAWGGEPTRPRLPRWRDNTDMIFIRGGSMAYRGREVRIRSFYMDRCEVTNGQYCQFLNDGKGEHWNVGQELERRGEKFFSKPGKDCWPVYSVTWHDADAYARWAGKRLPTDAEWLWAAAGKKGRKYAWGDEPITSKRANFGMHVGHPQPVGSYPEGRTPDGIRDMTGNVAEWCLDWFDPKHAPSADSPSGPDRGKRKIRRAGCFAMEADREGNREFAAPSPDYHPKCIGFRCVRPTRRVLVLLGENFAELEFAAYMAVSSWASHTNPEGNYMMPRGGAPSMPRIEVVVAGFGPEVRGMAGTIVRPHVLVRDLTDDQVDRFDAVAVPACVGSGRGQHTYKGWEDITSDRVARILRGVHDNGGIISTMCAGRCALKKAKLNGPKTSAETPVAFDPETRTATSMGPAVSVEAVCLLLKQLVLAEEYRSFRKYNPWLFGGKDQFAPRVENLR